MAISIPSQVPTFVPVWLIVTIISIFYPMKIRNLNQLYRFHTKNHVIAYHFPVPYITLPLRKP